MLGDLIVEAILAIVGDAIGSLLFPHRSHDEDRPPEGEWNASLGSIAGFVSALGATFGILSAVGVLGGNPHGLLWLFMGGAALLAMLAALLAGRALQVTRRRRGLATVALWLSRATLLICLAASLLSLAGIHVDISSRP